MIHCGAEAFSGVLRVVRAASTEGVPLQVARGLLRSE